VGLVNPRSRHRDVRVLGVQDVAEMEQGVGGVDGTARLADQGDAGDLQMGEEGSEDLCYGGQNDRVSGSYLPAY